MDQYLVEAMRERFQPQSFVGRCVLAVVLGILVGIVAYVVITWQ